MSEVIDTDEYDVTNRARGSDMHPQLAFHFMPGPSGTKVIIPPFTRIAAFLFFLPGF